MQRSEKQGHSPLRIAKNAIEPTDAIQQMLRHFCIAVALGSPQSIHEWFRCPAAAEARCSCRDRKAIRKGQPSQKPLADASMGLPRNQEETSGLMAIWTTNLHQCLTSLADHSVCLTSAALRNERSPDTDWYTTPTGWMRTEYLRHAVAHLPDRYLGMLAEARSAEGTRTARNLTGPNDEATAAAFKADLATGSWG
eukprot:CAMPEP_0170634584 /NCGR_PEP_ID=MMETSP0224-20130122/36694_1 /TAXON_ID=285029 /ORGANISM="Togula jolla, Strain CCCM 725" /LENGTH=195 /DNA_ID=CAMNT_0010963883 /DNA_START=288 /DNA_END=875 /DNA_ORIENTATION=-